MWLEHSTVLRLLRSLELLSEHSRVMTPEAGDVLLIYMSDVAWTWNSEWWTSTQGMGVCLMARGGGGGGGGGRGGGGGGRGRGEWKD